MPRPTCTAPPASCSVCAARCPRPPKRASCTISTSSWSAGRGPRRNFSWVEPTSWACLALRRLGQHDHPRVQEGLRLLLDRAMDEGGINYGNRTVLGKRTDPIPGPTALMLLALQGHDHPRIEPAVRYLVDQLEPPTSNTSAGPSSPSISIATSTASTQRWSASMKRSAPACSSAPRRRGCGPIVSGRRWSCSPSMPDSATSSACRHSSPAARQQPGC